MDNNIGTNFNLDFSTTYKMAQNMQANFEQARQDAFDVGQKEYEKREQSRIENQENLRRIADNSDETIASLKRINEVLEKQNQLLENDNKRLNTQVEEIVRIINFLVEITQKANDKQSESMETVNALALQLNLTAEENSKFDWKEFLANTSVNGILLGIQLFLKQHGL